MWMISTAEISDLPTVPVIAASLALVALAIALATWLKLGINRELVIASVRAAVQLLAVGVIFTALFGSNLAPLWAWLWIVLMVVISVRVVLARAKYKMPRLALVAGSVIGVSAVVSIAVTFGLGVIEFTPVGLVVVAGITIGNAMPAAVLAVNQSVTLARDHIGETEAALALGFDRRMMIRYLAPRAARAAMIPQIERTKVVGLIALPGAMTGLLLAGVKPFDAVVIQLIVMYLIVGAVALCVVGVTMAASAAAITDDIRPADWTRPGSASKPS
jgi:putative ABC transport system permease protein